MTLSPTCGLTTSADNLGLVTGQELLHGLGLFHGDGVNEDGDLSPDGIPVLDEDDEALNGADDTQSWVGETYCDTDGEVL